MTEQLGFQVIAAMPYRIIKFKQIRISAYSCRLQCHGAGLTNEVFLPDGQ